MESTETSLKVKIDGENAISDGKKLDAVLDKLEKTGNKVSKTIDKLGRETKETGKDFDKLKGNVGSTTAMMQKLKGVSLVAIASLSLKTVIGDYRNFETALIGVEKTTNLAGKSLDAYGKRMSDLSKKIPITATELLKLTETAGQMGVEGSYALEKYATTFAKLARTTDLQGEGAIKTLARIQKVTGENTNTIDILASSIVALGNTSAASESEIAHMTGEVARQTSMFKLSSIQAAALATSMKEMGVRAESGGTSIGRVFRSISNAVLASDEDFKQYTKTLKINGDELKNAFNEDKVEGFVLFLEALQKQGDRAAVSLDELGLGGTRLIGDILPLAKNLDTLRDKLELVNKELKNATALDAEFEKSLKSLDSQWTLFLNNVRGAGREAFIPVGQAITSVLKTLVDNFTILKNTVILISALIAGRFLQALYLSAAAFVANQIQIVRYNAALATMAGVSGVAATRTIALAGAGGLLRGAFAFLGGPLGVITLAATALFLFSTSSREARRDAETLKNELKQLGNEFDTLERKEKEALLQRNKNLLDTQKLNRSRLRNQDLYSNQSPEERTLLLGDIATANREIEETEATILRMQGVLDGTIKTFAKAEESITETSTATKELDTGIEDLIKNLKFKVSIMNETEREQLILNSINQAGANITKEQALQIRAYTGALYDNEKSLQAKEKAEADALKAMEDHRESMQDFLTEVIGSFIEGTGKIGDSFKDLWNRIKREFINSGVASIFNFKSSNTPILSGIAGLFSTGAAASGGGGGGGGFSLSNGLSAGNFLSKGLTSANLQVTSGIDKVANFLLQNGFENAGASVGNFGSSLANMPGGAIGGGLISAGAGFAGGYAGNKIGEGIFGKQANSSIATGIGTAIGTYILPGIGSAIGGLVGGIVDAAFGGDGKKRVNLGVSTIVGTPDRNAGQVLSESGLLLTGHTKRTGAKGVEAAKTLVAQFNSIDASLFSLAKNLGIDVDLSGSPLVGKSSEAGKSGGAFFGSAAYNKVDESQLAGAAEAFINSWVSAVNEKYNSNIDIKPVLDLQKENETLAGTLLRVGLQVDIINGLFSQMNFTLFDLSTSGIIAADALTEAFGGLENLTTGLNTYYNLFFSEQEKIEKLTSDVTAEFERLGVAMPKTKAGFKDLIKGLDLTDAAASKLFADLIGLAPALSTVLENIEAQTQIQIENQIALSTQIQDTASDIATNYNKEKTAILNVSNTRIGELQREKDAIERVSESLLKAASNLKLSSTSGLSNKEKLDFAQSEFNRLAALAGAGDLDAAGQLGGAANSYIQEASNFYATSDPFLEIFDSVTKQLEELGAEISGQGSGIDNQIASIQSETLSSIKNLGSTAKSQLSGIVSATAGINSIEILLALLPKEIANSLSAITGVKAADLSNDPIANLYKDVLGRDADISGYAYYQDQLDTGQLKSGNLTANFVGNALANGELSRDTVNSGGVAPVENLDYISQLYIKGLGAFDPVGYEYWKGREAEGATNEQLKAEFMAGAASHDQEFTEFRKGTAFVARDQIASIHAGEKIIDPDSSRILNKYGIKVQSDPNEKIIEALENLTSLVIDIHEDLRKNSSASQQIKEKQVLIMERDIRQKNRKRVKV